MNGRAQRAKRVPAFARGPIHSSMPKATATAEAGSKKGHFYKSLPTQFRHGEFDYQKIYREGDLAIYQQTWKGDEHSATFEVIRIRRHDGFQIGSRFVEPAEIYPNSKAWGVDGWTVQNEEAAFRKLQEIRMPHKKESANPVKKSPIQNTDRCPGTIEVRGDVNHRHDE